MADLSPAAQAVLDATFDHWPGGHNNPHKRVCIAAALRAAADRVVPEADANRDACRQGCIIGATPERIRRELLAIAAELKAHQAGLTPNIDSP